MFRRFKQLKVCFVCNDRTRSNALASSSSFSSSTKESVARSLFAHVNGKEDRLNRTFENAEHNLFLRIPPRRCIAMKALYPRDLLVRFVLAREEKESDAGGTKPTSLSTTWWVVPDVYEKSLDKKGKACYVSSSSVALEVAVKSNAFRHAFPNKNIKFPEDLIDVVRKGLKQNALSAFVNAVEKATDVVDTAWEEDTNDSGRNQRKGIAAETSTSSVFDRIRAEIDAFDSIRNDIREYRIVVVPKMNENDRNRKSEKKYGIIVCDLFTPEDLLGALKGASHEDCESSGSSGSNSIIGKIKERLQSNKENENIDQKFLTLKGVPNKDSFALQVSLLRYSGFL